MEVHYDVTDLLKEQELVPNSNITPNKLITNLEKELNKNRENDPFFENIKKQVIDELYKLLQPNLEKIYNKFKLLLENYEDYDAKMKEIGPTKSEKSTKGVYEKAEADEGASTKAKADEGASTKAKAEEIVTGGGRFFNKRLSPKEKALKELGQTDAAAEGDMPKAKKTSKIKEKKEPFVINEEIIEKITKSRKERLFLEKFRVTFNYNKIFMNKLLKDIKFVEYKKPKPKMANKYLEGALKYLVSYTSLFDNTRISLGSKSGVNDLIKYKILSLIKQYGSLEKSLSLTEIVIKETPSGAGELRADAPADEPTPEVGPRQTLDNKKVILDFYYKYKYYSIFQNYLRKLNEIKAADFDAGIMTHEMFDDAMDELQDSLDVVRKNDKIKKNNDEMKKADELKEKLEKKNTGLHSYYRGRIRFIVKKVYEKVLKSEDKKQISLILDLIRNMLISYKEKEKDGTAVRDAATASGELALAPTAAGDAAPADDDAAPADDDAAPASAAASPPAAEDAAGKIVDEIIEMMANPDAEKLIPKLKEGFFDNENFVPRGKTSELRSYINKIKELGILDYLSKSDGGTDDNGARDDDDGGGSGGDDGGDSKPPIESNIDMKVVLGGLMPVAEIRKSIIDELKKYELGKEILKNFDDQHNYNFSSEFYDNLVDKLFLEQSKESKESKELKLLIKTLLKDVNLNLNDDVIMGKKLDEKFIKFKPAPSPSASSSGAPDGEGGGDDDSIDDAEGDGAASEAVPDTTAEGDNNQRGETYGDGSSIVGVNMTDDYFIQVSRIPLLKNKIDKAGTDFDSSVAKEVKTQLARN